MRSAGGQSRNGIAHVDVSGQDNGSSMVFVAVSITGAARDALWRQRREIERLSRKDNMHGR
jgi:hypothetical protein